MSRAALQSLDADIHAALAESGLADTGLYLPPGAAPGATATPVRCYLTRDAEFYGELGQVAGRRDQITVLRADITPERKGTIALDGELYELPALVTADDGVTVWQARSIGVAP